MKQGTSNEYEYTQLVIIYIQYKYIPKWSPFVFWPGTMINPHWLELSICWTNFHSPKGVRAIEVRLHLEQIWNMVKKSITARVIQINWQHLATAVYTQKICSSQAVLLVWGIFLLLVMFTYSSFLYNFRLVHLVCHLSSSILHLMLQRRKW